MIVVAGVVAGFLAARLAWLLLRSTMTAPPFVVQNFRGRSVTTAAGLVVAVAVVVVEAARSASGFPADRLRAAVAVLVLGMAFLGLLDDLAGSPDDRGFRGHLRALARGRLTTGGLKLAGGAAVAVVAVSLAEPTGRDRDWLALLADAALVALAANLGNLFDRAPGRVLKVALLGGVALAVGTGADESLAAVAVAWGAAMALLHDDLRERVMLGDTGANTIGAVLGLAVVATGATGTRLAMLAVVLLLNAAAEVVSYSRVIDAFPPFRAFDRLGRKP